mgnify:CR=1 FL=1
MEPRAGRRRSVKSVGLRGIIVMYFSPRQSRCGSATRREELVSGRPLLSSPGLKPQLALVRPVSSAIQEGIHEPHTVEEESGQER